MWGMISGDSIFFFQAEDGIRDLVRSRGLGDVYKRQEYKSKCVYVPSFAGKNSISAEISWRTSENPILKAVSYTHLTLPTSDLV